MLYIYKFIYGGSDLRQIETDKFNFIYLVNNLFSKYLIVIL